MEVQDALQILRALANGTDPETGAKLEDGSTCRRPRTVIALNRAVNALAQEGEREKRRPANAFRKWTRDEDAQVCEEIRQGMDFREIAKAHNRTIASILARLVKLGKISTTPPPKAA